MKKLFAIAAFAALFSVSACDVLADMISTVPTFSVDNVVYDGQQQRLVRAAMCAYEWKVNHPEFCTINVDPKDSTAMAHFYLDEGTKACEITITATNMLHPDKTVEQKTSLRKWTVDICDASGTVVATPQKGMTYTLKLIDRIDEKPIERIYREIKLKSGYVYENVEVKFMSGTSTLDFGLATVSENTEFSFTIPENFDKTSFTISTTVGTKNERKSYNL